MSEQQQQVPYIKVQNDESAARQLRLHHLKALSEAVLNEELAHRPGAPSNRPYVAKGDLAGHEIGTALSRLEALIVPLRQVETRTTEQDTQLAELEARHRASCQEAAELSTGGRSSGLLGSYSYRIPHLEIRSGTVLERHEGCRIELRVSDATGAVRGAHEALLAAYGPRGLERSPVTERRGLLDVTRELDPIVMMYWFRLLDWAELIRLEGERHRAGVELAVPVATGISDEYRERIRAKYRAA